MHPVRHRAGLRVIAPVLFLLACIVCADASATPATTREEFAGRVLFDVGNPQETFDEFIVYYRGDAGIGDERSKAASDTLLLLDDDMARVGSVFGVFPAHQRRLATGGHLIRAGAQMAGGAEAEAFMVEFARNPQVLSIEPNARAWPTRIPNDPGYAWQWGLSEITGGINPEPAWDRATGTGVVIAVVDTGRTPHPDLDALTVPGYDFISDMRGRDGNGRDLNPNDEGDWNAAGECGNGSPAKNSTWHGTHVAGIAAAQADNSQGIAGVAYNARIQHVRVLGLCGGSTADIADGMIWASGAPVSGVPTNSTPARVINLSLGGIAPCGTTYQTAINTARARGSVLLVAAGNDSIPASQASPANCTGVVTVAATNRAGQRANYSNYGVTADIAAPGGETGSVNTDGIVSTINTGTTVQAFPDFAYYQGTSMATPFVAGVAALMLSHRPALTPDQIETILRNTARPFPNFCSGGCGTGIMDAGAAMRAAAGEAITSYPVSVALYGNGQGNVRSTAAGINCGHLGSSCGARFAASSTLTLQAQPAAGYEFAGWAGACSGMQANCVVAMNRGHAVYATFRYPVRTLVNGTPVGALASSGGVPLFFAIQVPADATQLRFEMSGGSGDADLHVRYGIEPDAENYDCRPYVIGNTESCNVPTPQAGVYYAMLVGDPNFSGVSLRASYVRPASGGIFCDSMEPGGTACRVP